MPGRNGTGPLGMGPLTGRGLGPCGGGYFSYRRPRLGLRYGYGRGFGRGYGRGLGYYGYYGPYPYEPYPVDESIERAFIEEEKAILEARLKGINEILDESQDEDE